MPLLEEAFTRAQAIKSQIPQRFTVHNPFQFEVTFTNKVTRALSTKAVHITSAPLRAGPCPHLCIPFLTPTPLCTPSARPPHFARPPSSVALLTRRRVPKEEFLAYLTEAFHSRPPNYSCHGVVFEAPAFPRNRTELQQLDETFDLAIVPALKQAIGLNAMAGQLRSQLPSTPPPANVARMQVGIDISGRSGGPWSGCGCRAVSVLPL